jgi:predicted metal-dependent phosphoesterase TrpH
VFADLHLHTHFSDGTYSPEELAAAAARQSLSAIAVTDHDTMEGVAQVAEACRRRQIEFVPGTELTAELNGQELHLLGYYLDPKCPALRQAMHEFQEVRQQRIREMVQRLNDCGVPLQSESVFALANCRSPGRPHVARALVAQRICATSDEAFDRFLKKNRPGWVPKFKISAAAAIQLIHKAHGLAVLAHPGLYHLDRALPQLAEEGLDGIECFHTKHTASTTEHYVKTAKHLRLATTGGSDCHGFSKGQPLIGSVKIPMAWLSALKERLSHPHPLPEAARTPATAIAGVTG